MIDDVTKKDIEKTSLQLLKSSKALDVFPTPVEDILNYSDFIINNQIDLLNIETPFLENLKEKSKSILQSGLSKIRGIFDREEKIIYVDAGLNKNLGKKKFVQLHEIGHGVLKWQNDITLYLDNDETLSSEVEEQFEEEANYFASITLFQHDRFINEAGKLNLGLSSVVELSKRFGASIHATFRNYVLKSKNRCALLVLTPLKGVLGNSALCETRNLFYSKSFLKDIGELKLPNEFGFKWDFIQDYKFRRRFHEKGELELVTEHGEVISTNYHFFDNTYNSFVFIFPKGEKNKAKTKVILEGI